MAGNPNPPAGTLATLTFDGVIAHCDQRWTPTQQAEPGRLRPTFDPGPAIVSLEFTLDGDAEITLPAWQQWGGKRVRVTVEQIAP